jgi:hypothetical protein
MFTFVHFWPEPNPHFRLMYGGGSSSRVGTMVIARDYFTRQATILFKFAKATKDQKVAASLIEKAADLNLQVDEPGARPDPNPLAAPDVQPEK